MTIYVVTSGEYDDYHIVEIFDNWAAAVEYVDFVNDYAGFEQASIEDREVLSVAPTPYYYWTGNYYWNELEGSPFGPHVNRLMRFEPPEYDVGASHYRIKGNKHLPGATKDEKGSWLYYDAIVVGVEAASEERAVLTLLSRMSEEIQWRA